MKAFSKTFSPEEVNSIIDFGSSTLGDGQKSLTMKKIQSEGVAAIYNILCKNNFAYLADEVGMGKTYQAFGVMSLLWTIKPDARIVIICPRRNIQNNWIDEYNSFIRVNYRAPFKGVGDDRIKSILLNQPVFSPIACHNLWEFLEYFTLRKKSCLFLKHTSFRAAPIKTVKGRSDFNNARNLFKSYNADSATINKSPNIENAKIKKKEDEKKAVNKALNIWFAKAAGSVLKRNTKEKHAIDLLIIDEAQYLRHYDNSSNTMIREIFNDNVDKWLYLSATPLHNGKETIKNTVNEYSCKDYITKEDCDNSELFQKKLQTFLIRRPRTYVIDGNGGEIGKTKYRHHNNETDSISLNETIPSLSIALIQKKLVNLIDNNNNRLKIGFLSSFESLQDSLNKKLETDFENSEDSQTEDSIESESGVGRQKTNKAPDETFISKLNNNFKENFRFELPHPKLSYLVNNIYKNAFLEDEKYLIFVRRRSTVDELRRMFEQKFIELLSVRVKKVWDQKLDWNHEKSVNSNTVNEKDLPDEIEDDNSESTENIELADTDTNVFRQALEEGGWLFNFRRSFRGSGKYSMFFQENWFFTILKNNAENIADKIPANIWRESLTFSRRNKGYYKALRFQYLITQLLLRNPEIFNLSSQQVYIWRNFFSTIYRSATVKVKQSNSSKYIDRDLVLHRGFWEYWNDKFSCHNNLCLPDVFQSESRQLFMREITKSWINQYLMLSDPILDFYYAEKGKTEEEFLEAVYKYFCEEDDECIRPYSKLIRNRFKNWIKHNELILNKCFKLGKLTIGEFAARMTYKELANPRPVVGIKGGAMNDIAIKQFKTPGFPQILICTDVLKEGENLHLFCDKVIHYGLAWTAGDLEQRVGRVDRYFSQIERRLSEAENKDDIKLMIYYPHLLNTIECEQVERVIKRQKIVESIMDTQLTSDENSQKEIRIGEKYLICNSLNDPVMKNIPFAPRFLKRSQKVPTLSSKETEKRLEYYRNIKTSMRRICKALGIEMELEDKEFNGILKIPLKSEENAGYNQWELKLLYIPEFESYALSCQIRSSMDEYLNSDTLKPNKKASKNITDNPSYRFSFHKEIRENTEYIYKSIKIFIPFMPRNTKQIEYSIAYALNYLKSGYIEKIVDIGMVKELKKTLKKHLKYVTDGDKDNKININVNFGERSQSVSIYLYDGMIFLASRVGKEKNVLYNKKTFDDNIILTLNSRIPFGYFSKHNGYITFCKRFFCKDYKTDFLIKMIKTIAEQADIYELRYSGLDKM